MTTKTKSITRETAGISVAEFVVLFLLGALAIFLHAKLRIPLKLPGHHGVEFMMLLLIGRNITSFRFAGSISSLGVLAMIFLPFMGFKDPFATLLFIIPGISMDLFYNFAPRTKSKFWFLAIIAGISYSLIPIGRFVITLLTGFPYESLISGVAYPFATHFIFGFIGGMAGTGIATLFRK